MTGGFLFYNSYGVLFDLCDENSIFDRWVAWINHAITIAYCFKNLGG